MTSAYNFTITSGLPFSRDIVVTLPTGRSWWNNISDFEVLFQIRKDRKRKSELVLDATQYLSVTMLDANAVRIRFEMTGEDTRLLTKNGYYDIVISDVGKIDARAYQVILGSVTRTTIISAEEVGLQ